MNILFGISSDRQLTIQMLLALHVYAEVGDMHLCIPQTGVQSTLSIIKY